MTSNISVEVTQGIATITLNEPHRLNALRSEGLCCTWTTFLWLNSYSRADYTEFANTLRAIDKREDVIATVWQGK